MNSDQQPLFWIRSEYGREDPFEADDLEHAIIRAGAGGSGWETGEPGDEARPFTVPFTLHQDSGAVFEGEWTYLPYDHQQGGFGFEWRQAEAAPARRATKS